MDTLTVKKGYSKKGDVLQALEEIETAIKQPEASVVLLFVSSHYDLKLLGAGIASTFDAPVIACTTSGELSPLGYPDSSISAVSIASPRLEVKIHLIEDLQYFSINQGGEISENILTTLRAKWKNAPDTQAFGLLLIDGLSVAEENVAANLWGILGSVPFIGGSAGDDFAFKETFVYHDGAFLPDSAIFATFFTDHPFKVFKTQHFVPNEEVKMVITKAEPEQRIVREINGMPAAQEYAKFVGLEIDSLEPTTFSKHPVMLKIGGEYYVRSIAKVNEDESLTFFCAIDEGLVLTLAKGIDLRENLEQTFRSIQREFEPKVIIGCECILRRLEILEKGIQDQVAATMNKYNVIGFHTYGEQFNGLHINQTFTGIALGE